MICESLHVCKVLGNYYLKGVRIMVFNATCYTISVISWQSVVLVEETIVPRENN